MNYRVGYIDDEETVFPSLKKKICRISPDIDLIYLRDCTLKEDFVEKILDERIEVLLVDYKMAQTFGYNGTTLINFINDRIKDLKCYILTAVGDSEISDNLVEHRDRFQKTIIDTEGEDEERLKELKGFIHVLCESAKVFRTRRKLKTEEYRQLLHLKMEGRLSVQKEEEFRNLYKVLVSYGDVENIPERLLEDAFEKRLDTLIEIGNKIIEEKRRMKE